MKKQHKIIVGLIAVALISILAVFQHLEGNKWTAATYQLDELKESEKKFSNTNDINECVSLLSLNYGIKDYEKVIEYGNKCIDLGIEKTSQGFVINFWIAASYEKLRNKKKARHYLERALENDNESFLTEHEWIEKEGLQYLIN